MAIAAPSRGAAAEERGSFTWRQLWPLALLSLATLAIVASGASDYLSLSTIIREHVALAEAVDDHAVMTALLYIGIYVAAVAVSFPGASMLTILGGYLFGPFVGAAFTIVAATIGATILFMIARTSFGDVLRAKAGRLGARVAEGFERDAFSYLLFLRLVPICPFWLLNIVPALFEVRLRTYVVATALGIIPGTLAFTLLGDSLGDIIASAELAHPGCSEAGTCQIEWGAFVQPGPIIAMAALTLTAVVPFVVKRLRRSPAAPQ